jgi:carbon-monoxide dehydrogenase medium subunit
VKNFEYFRPETLREASELLVKYGENARILNGGTDVVIQLNEGHSKPEAVVDIKGIKELHELKFDENEGLFVGACVPLNKMGEDDVVYNKFRFLAEAAHSVGSRPIRNRATCAGNICNASPLADTATPLLALDATVLVYGPEGEKEISIHDFFTWVRQTCLKEGEIVTGIKVPAKEVKGLFQKISRRKEVDLSTVCSTIVRDGEEFRLAFGSIAPTPLRLRKTEEFLKGKEITADVVKEAQELAVSEISPIGDARGSREYRIEMVKVLVKRALNELK